MGFMMRTIAKNSTMNASLKLCMTLVLACPRVISVGSASSPAKLRTQAQQPSSAEKKKSEGPQEPQEQRKEQAKDTAREAKPLSPAERAWGILYDGLAENSADKRAKAANALGLVTRNDDAEEAALDALKDEKVNVRLAAVSALGSMRAPHANSALERALDDEEPAVVLAAANALMLLKDYDSAYEIYYGVLTGTTRTNKGFIKENLKILKDKKKLAEMGFEQGIGFIPFAGFGYDAYKTITKSDGPPLRAAAAKRLAHDPSPVSADALVAATEDKNWIVRAAALDAISERGDRSLIPRITLALDDDKDDVRFAAAGCIAHLSDLPAKSRAGAKSPTRQ
jgi:HEAT repeat protein